MAFPRERIKRKQGGRIVDQYPRDPGRQLLRRGDGDFAVCLSRARERNAAHRRTAVRRHADCDAAGADRGNRQLPHRREELPKLPLLAVCNQYGLHRGDAVRRPVLVPVRRFSDERQHGAPEAENALARDAYRAAAGYAGRQPLRQRNRLQHFGGEPLRPRPDQFHRKRRAVSILRREHRYGGEVPARQAVRRGVPGVLLRRALHDRHVFAVALLRSCRRLAFRGDGVRVRQPANAEL